MNPEYLLLAEAPIVNEFTIFLQYAIDQKMLLTRTKGLLGGGVLSQLNQEMTYQVKGVSNKHPQYRFHLLNIFYHLSLGGHLVKIEKKGGHLYLLPTQKAFEYLSLHPVEKYFFLLETLWVDMDWFFFDEYKNSSASSNFNLYLLCISQEKVGEVIKLEESEPFPLRYLHSSGCLAHLLSSLGFIRMFGDTYEDKAYKSIVYIDAISPTHHGAYLGSILAQKRSLLDWNWPYYTSLRPYITREDFLEDKEEGFLDPFLDHYPSLNETLVYDPNEAMTPGNYVFSVYKGDAHRRIMMPYTMNLCALNSMIKESFGFTEDFYCSFTFSGPTKEKIYYTYPRKQETRDASAALLGSLSLYPRKTFSLRFYDEDELDFFIEVESFKEGEALLPKILGGEGDST